jgi:hypothetical protein
VRLYTQRKRDLLQNADRRIAQAVLDAADLGPVQATQGECLLGEASFLAQPPHWRNRWRTSSMARRAGQCARGRGEVARADDRPEQDRRQGSFTIYALAE